MAEVQVNVRERLRRMVAERLNAPEEQVTDDSRFDDDLGADSLDRLEIAMQIEEEFAVQIGDDELPDLKTFKQLVDTVERLRDR